MKATLITILLSALLGAGFHASARAEEPADAGDEMSLAQDAGLNNIFSWGNYCGAGRNGNHYQQKPTDNLDAACMRHDRCLVNTGHADGSASCRCEKSFGAELDRVIADPKTTFAARTFARGAKAWTSGRENSSCN